MDDVRVTDPIHEAATEYTDKLRQKILFGLSIYKFVSPSQLHVFLGTSTPSSLWKDQVLTQLIADGLVISETVTLTSSFDRAQSYTVLHLPENVYITPQDTATAASDPEPTCATTDNNEDTTKLVA